MHRYNAYSDYFKALFGGRAQKLSIDGGFSCPNRDGSKGVGGCTFCNNEAFSPSYLRGGKSITQQIDEGIAFHAWRYHSPAAYLAYFQAYSNTYAPLDTLRARYEEALNHPQVRGIIVGTRPDCVDEQVLDYLQGLAQERGCYVAVEYGLESIHDATLSRINRHHDMACSRHAVALTAARGIPCGAHFILGLPGESRDDMLAYAAVINAMPLHSVKFHQLQVLRGSAMEHEEVPSFDVEEYIALVCDIVERLRPDLIIERFAGEVPPRYQARPERAWRRPDGRLLRNEEVPQLVDAELQRRGTRQGSRHFPSPDTINNAIVR